MDIESLKNIKEINEDNIDRLFDPSFLYRDDREFNYIEIRQEHEMRIDLVLMDMYNLEPNEVVAHLDKIDVILYINGIINPLNIIKGDILRFPSLESIDDFRVSEESIESSKMNNKNKLSVPNKSTRRDKNRQKFKDNDYSLPPVVLNSPKNPVSIKNGNFKIGGI